MQWAFRFWYAGKLDGSIGTLVLQIDFETIIQRIFPWRVMVWRHGSGDD